MGAIEWNIPEAVHWINGYGDTTTHCLQKPYCVTGSPYSDKPWHSKFAFFTHNPNTSGHSTTFPFMSRWCIQCGNHIMQSCGGELSVSDSEGKKHVRIKQLNAFIETFVRLKYCSMFRQRNSYCLQSDNNKHVTFQRQWGEMNPPHPGLSAPSLRLINVFKTSHS